MRLSGKEAIPPSNEAMPLSHGFVGGTSRQQRKNRARANRAKKKQALDLQGLESGGDSWTRTNDPIDVNDVLYRLSHATTLLVYTSYHFGLPTEPTDHALVCSS